MTLNATSEYTVVFLSILVTVVGGRLKPELCFMLGRLR